MRNKLFLAILPLAAAMLFVSCDKETTGTPEKQEQAVVKPAKSMGLDVLPVIETIQTKAGETPAGKLTNVFGSEEDGLVIEEYVSDYDFAAPATKGTEIKTGNIAAKYGEFQVIGISDFTEKDVRHQELHFSEKSKYLSGRTPYEWDWEGESPVWRVNTKETIWSVAPAIVGSDSLVTVSDIDPTSPNSFSFDYSVPSDFTDQQDILFAYNVEEREWEQVNPYDTYEWTWVDGQDSTFKVDFYHALAAVKFELASSTEGANVHSITICCTDPASGNNIVYNNGIARYGECTVTGSGSGTGSVNFAWDPAKLGNKKPLHYTFNDSYPANSNSVAGGFASSGNGVSFMIPQEAQGLKIIVEFSKYGGSQYYTVVKDFGSQGAAGGIKWEAGKYYLYKLKIGEFHVPGENIPGLNHVAIDKLMTAGTTGEKIPATPLKIKGVKTIGLVIEKYGLGVDDDSKKIVMYGLFGTTNSSGQTVMNDQFSGVSANNVLTKPDVPFDFNFANVSSTALDNTDGKIYSFGQGGNTTEQYHLYYQFSKTEGKNKTPTEKAGPYYAAFQIPNNTDCLQVMVKSSASDNSCGFAMTPRCFIVLEVQKDSSFPTNWNSFLSDKPWLD